MEGQMIQIYVNVNGSDDQLTNASYDYNWTVAREGGGGGAANASVDADVDTYQYYIISLFLSCLYTVFLFPIGFIGNILILVVTLNHRDKMTIPDLYFVNLAVADLILVADSLIEVFNLNEKYYDIAILCTFMSLFLQVSTLKIM